GRVALAHDLALWSAHDGEDTLFYQFAQQARAACNASCGSPLPPGEGSGVRGSSSAPDSASPDALTLPRSDAPTLHAPTLAHPDTPTLRYSGSSHASSSSSSNSAPS